jgi:hypothetical protein
MPCGEWPDDLDRPAGFQGQKILHYRRMAHPAGVNQSIRFKEFPTLGKEYFHEHFEGIPALEPEGLLNLFRPEHIHPFLKFPFGFPSLQKK